MKIHGLKTKTGCAVMVLAAALFVFHPMSGGSLFMLGSALAFYGLYDRGGRNTQAHIAKIDELKSRIKKPMLRG